MKLKSVFKKLSKKKRIKKGGVVEEDEDDFPAKEIWTPPITPTGSPYKGGAAADTTATKSMRVSDYSTAMESFDGSLHRSRTSSSSSTGSSPARSPPRGRETGPQATALLFEDENQEILQNDPPKEHQESSPTQRWKDVVVAPDYNLRQTADGDVDIDDDEKKSWASFESNHFFAPTSEKSNPSSFGMGRPSAATTEVAKSIYARLKQETAAVAAKPLRTSPPPLPSRRDHRASSWKDDQIAAATFAAVAPAKSSASTSSNSSLEQVAAASVVSAQVKRWERSRIVEWPDEEEEEEDRCPSPTANDLLDFHDNNNTYDYNEEVVEEEKKVEEGEEVEYTTFTKQEQQQEHQSVQETMMPSKDIPENQSVQETMMPKDEQPHDEPPPAAAATTTTITSEQQAAAYFILEEESSITAMSKSSTNRMRKNSGGSSMKRKIPTNQSASPARDLAASTSSDDVVVLENNKSGCSDDDDDEDYSTSSSAPIQELDSDDEDDDFDDDDVSSFSLDTARSMTQGTDPTYDTDGYTNTDGGEAGKNWNFGNQLGEIFMDAMCMACAPVKVDDDAMTYDA